jgi:hypothetical protein
MSAIWRTLSGLAAGGAAVALYVGANDLNHPDWHSSVELGTLQFAHWCYVVALVTMVIATFVIFALRNTAGATVAWFGLTLAVLVFYVGGTNLVGVPNHITAAGTGTALALSLAGWVMLAVLIVIEVRRSANSDLRPRLTA